MAHKMQGEKSLRRGSKSSLRKFTIFFAEVHEVLCRLMRGTSQELRESTDSKSYVVRCQVVMPLVP